MGGLDESSEFGGGNEGDVARTSAPDDNGFLLVYNLIQNVRQVLAEARIRRFNRHGTPSSHCTAFLYARLHGADGRVCDMKVEAAAFLFFLHPLPERM